MVRQKYFNEKIVSIEEVRILGKEAKKSITHKLVYVIPAFSDYPVFVGFLLSADCFPLLGL